MRKSAAWVQLCQTKAEYRNAWDRGRGPGQIKTTPASERKAERRRRGVGTELRKMIGWRCGGFGRAATLNAWGVDGCRERSDQIVQWIIDTGDRGGGPIGGHAAGRLLRLAIERCVTSD
jgi:hypothetical protein